MALHNSFNIICNNKNIIQIENTHSSNPQWVFHIVRKKKIKNIQVKWKIDILTFKVKYISIDRPQKSVIHSFTVVCRFIYRDDWERKKCGMWFIIIAIQVRVLSFVNCFVILFLSLFFVKNQFLNSSTYKAFFENHESIGTYLYIFEWQELLILYWFHWKTKREADWDFKKMKKG